MRNALFAAVFTLALAGLAFAAGTPSAAVRAALKEAQLQMAATQWAAATRVLKDLRQQLSLDPHDQPVRIRVEMIMWDLRMGFNEHAVRDLDALVTSLAP